MILRLAVLCLTLSVPPFPGVAEALGQEGCADVPGCRAAALEAAARQDYETFHDLAWRAVQRGRPNDPDLMYLVARAQSLSGRPGDALVMLRRLAQMGIATDAAANDDFRRVRALAGWPEIEALLAGVAEHAAPAAPAVIPKAKTTTRRAPEKAAPPVPPPTVEAGSPVPARPAEAAPLVPTRPAKAAPPVATRPAEAAPPISTPPPAAAPTSGEMAPESLAEDALRLDAVLPDPVGLAHDAVSRRFIVGDRRLNSLVVVDEVFNRITNMVAAASAGFFGLTGFEIDRARGDLWVANSSRDGGASLHKLQLISGRVLYSVQLPDDAGPADFRDIAVTPGGTVTVLDASGARILRLRPGRRAFEAPAPVDLEDPTSLAAPDEQAAYVAHRGGLARVSVADGATTPLDAAPGIDLRGLRRIWSFNGSLVALQAHGSTTRIVRIALGGGGARALRLRVLDPDAAIVNETMATLGQADLYYVTQRDGRNVVRRLRLN